MKTGIVRQRSETGSTAAALAQWNPEGLETDRTIGLRSPVHHTIMEREMKKSRSLSRRQDYLYRGLGGLWAAPLGLSNLPLLMHRQRNRRPAPRSTTSTASPCPYG